MSRYLVVIHPPTVDNVGRDTANYSVPKVPAVRWVTARSANAAVAQVRVEPGGHALVIDEAHIARYDRAKEAPLEQRRPDGNPLDRAMAA